jgi:hypothetical protein
MDEGPGPGHDETMTPETSNATLTSEQVLDELEFLATVEHALVVEYLTLSCALGHDLEVAEGGATSTQGREGARAASSLAQGEMFHLAGIVKALTDAGRTPALGRAASIKSASIPEVPLDPPTADQLRLLLDREKAISTAVDERYAALVPAVTSAPVFEGALLETLHQVVVDAGGTHTRGFDSLRDALGDPPPPDFLRVPRRETNDTFEQRLLDVSDRVYRLVTTALGAQFAQPDTFGFRDLATSAMDALDVNNHALAQRGLLPPFTL